MTLEEAWQAFSAGVVHEEEEWAKQPHLYPHFSADGLWHRVPIDETSGWVDDSFYDHGNWTAGFTVGGAWLRRAAAGEREAPELLNKALGDIARRADDETTHDLGFLFHPSFVLGSALGFVADEELGPARLAARTLAGRFNSAGGYLQAFGPTGDPRSATTSTIDTMMNLPLLWWASSLDEGDEEMFEVARQHALTSAKSFFRDDGSSYHLIRLDPSDGAIVHQGTFQGASEESCWSRGQAWAIAGFAWAYAAAGDDVFYETADKAWDYFLSRVPSDGIVPWDFSDASGEPTRDASASAIAALGGLILSEYHPSEERRAALRSESREILSRLAASAVRRTPNGQGILLQSCYSKPHGLGVGGATPYGDFYYGLALALATGRVSWEQLVPRRPSAAGADRNTTAHAPDLHAKRDGEDG